jgi:hypothetical protein
MKEITLQTLHIDHEVYSRDSIMMDRQTAGWMDSQTGINTHTHISLPTSLSLSLLLPPYPDKGKLIILSSWTR